MWVVAHRGGGALFPENSLTAFQSVAALGVDFVECDVHLSADGHLMVVHDRSLKRTANLDVNVDSLSRRELEGLDVGDGHGVPALEDVLTAVDVPLRVELKTPETLQALIALLERHPSWRDRMTPTSFNHLLMRELNTAIPGLLTGALLSGLPVHPGTVARDASCRFLSIQYAMLTASYVDRCHQEEILLTAWTPNQREEIEALVEMGIDGITSDRPDLVLAARRV
jgi:glycerophosphoryl diester phosphodiesterase